VKTVNPVEIEQPNDADEPVDLTDYDWLVQVEDDFVVDDWDQRPL
jgi:hypothetical protein